MREPLRALIVEDHAATAEAIARVLAREGFTAVATHQGADGGREARGGGYDLLVLDLRLPDLDGVELCRSLRQEGHWVPILMVSGRGSTTDVVRGLEAGADDYLPKPFAVDELRVRVRALARRHHRDGRAPVLAPAPLELDRSTREVVGDDQRVELSPREFELLEVLLDQEGRVCSRAHLLRRVWRREEDGGKLVDVYVGYLRRKLQRVGVEATIETVRGVGYRLTLPSESG
ncbi:response regulator transcription factor [Nitriliruptor alkaliphilus]|uniref:response regulator transcription factor n=1 Tax=Nitriliruptor alkaliphilus TaxID=427918 RepID=UPI000698144C|nr:response regulator transcription factor [Nitriliruptor alkaliphilus]